MNFQILKLVLEKAGRTRDQIANIHWIIKKTRELATHSHNLAWELPWTEEPVGYSPWGGKELDTIEWLNNNKKYQVYNPT